MFNSYGKDRPGPESDNIKTIIGEFSGNRTYFHKNGVEKERDADTDTPRETGREVGGESERERETEH